MIKSVSAVTLTKRASFLNGHTYKETEGVTSKDRHKLFGFGPKAVFVVTEDYNARFRVMGELILVLIDCKDAHGKDSMRSPFLLEGAIFAKSNFLIVERWRALWLDVVEGVKRRRATQ